MLEARVATRECGHISVAFLSMKKRALMTMPAYGTNGFRAHTRRDGFVILVVEPRGE